VATDARARLASIAIVAEAAPAVLHSVDSGNVPLLLGEIRHALERLLATGAIHAIDLRTIPLGPGEEERLLAALGTGELCATFDALGRSELQECGYPGVWRVTHRNEGGEVVADLLEVCDLPEILRAPAEDAANGLIRLKEALQP